ncbi:unnamed protein product [Musa acuminata var. zebrina]
MGRRPMSRSRQGRGAMSSRGGRIPSRPLAANAEALKRNVDCFYFIASPTTCTKGSKCEYRHSEGARFNPKDCLYWLKGNCLNPRCTFRHRPLESLFGNPRAMAVPAEPSSSTAVQVAERPPPNNINRNTTPCYFFMKGKCLKGDECPFRHGVGTPLDLHKDQQSTPGVSAVKAGQCRFQSMEEALEYFKKDKELKGESSHDRIEDSDFFRDVDECAAAWLQRGRTLDFPDQCNDPQSDHQREKDQHTENRESEMYGSLHGREQQKTSFEWTLDRSMLEKGKLREESYDELADEPVPRSETDQHRGLHGRDEKLLEGPSMRTKSKPREESNDELDPCDLRHQLPRVRRPKDSGRVSDPDDRGSHRYVHDDSSHAQHSQWDRQSLGRGRSKSIISLPTKSSPDRPTGWPSAIDTDRERKRRRLSPAMLMNDQESCARLDADSSSGAKRTSGGRTAGKDVAYPSDFPGPKSLAELRGAKASQTSYDEKRLSSSETADHQEYGSSLSFEGPLPLSVILQRKREAAPEKSAISSNGEGDNQGDADDHVWDPAEDGGNVPEASKGTTVDEEEEVGRIAKELLDGEDEVVNYEEAAEGEDNEFEVDEDDFAKMVGDLSV